MQANSFRNRQDRRVLRSNCDGVYFNGNAQQLVEKWQVRSDQARLEDDLVMAERFGQQAEHYRRVQSV